LNYLYGDSTESTLKANFLEFLRDAIDFSSFVLGAEHNIRNWKKQRDALREEAAAETKRLQGFVGTVIRAIDDAPKGDSERATARCASLVRALTNTQLQNSIDAVEQQLATEIAAIDAEEAVERARCSGALETLLVPHAPPDARTVRSIVLRGADSYVGSVAGTAAFGLSWQIALAVPAAWSSPMTVEQVYPQLTIRAPQLSGWINKEVKLKAQRLDRHVVTEVVDDDDSVTIKLRAEANDDVGYDFDVHGQRVTAVRVAAAAGKEDSSLGPFELDPADVPKVIELAGKLHTMLTELKPQKLENAAFGETPFDEQTTFVNVIERMIGMMAPITREIAERSLLPNELVLRRLLSGDRREEIFVTKASLCEKYATLPEPLRAFFAPLGLEADSRKRADAPRDNAPITRSELKPSVRPAPPPVEEDPIVIPAPPSVPSNKKDEFVAAIRNILALAKKGSLDEAYRAYETLFQGDDFEIARLEDQRQALKLMLNANPPTPASEAVIDAHLAAIMRLQHLVEEHHEPADYELLGLACSLIEDTDAAQRAFRAGLELEREKNASSDLAERLAKRLDN
jgi:hypothetical protein